MTSLLENLDQSDNEEINRLFPKCKPKNAVDCKLTHTVDANLNSTATIVTTAIKESPAINTAYLVDSNENFSCMLNDGDGRDGEDAISANDLVKLVLDLDSGNNKKRISECNSVNSGGGVGPLFGVMATNDGLHGGDLDSAPNGDSGNSMDHSVISGYGDPQSPTSQQSDTNSGVPCVVARRHHEYKLRDSRIEIAGGREVFSQSKSKAMRKRNSEDASGTNRMRKVASSSSGGDTTKRHSGEILYGEKQGCYAFRTDLSTWTIGEPWMVPVPKENGSRNKGRTIVYDTVGVEVHQDADSPTSSGLTGKSSPFAIDVTALPEHRKSRPETTTPTHPVVYEASIGGNSEVVFDDIGDWVARCNVYQPSNGKGKLSPIEVGSSPGHFRPRSKDSDSSASSSRDTEESPSTTSRRTLSLSESYDKVLMSPVDDTISSSRDRGGGGGGDGDATPERRTSGGLRVIGNVPIAEYEGSPRRYGPRPVGHPAATSANNSSVSPSRVKNHCASPSAGLQLNLVSSSSSHVPRPGFPKRVYPMSPQQYSLPSDVLKVDVSPSLTVRSGTLVDVSVSGSDSTTGSDSPPRNAKNEENSQPVGFHETPGSCGGDDVAKDQEDYDFSYEISETRKVLEEFFKHHPEANSGDKKEIEFSELDYKLYRQTGNSYVGQRLAKGFAQDAEESPNKTPANDGLTLGQDLISLNDHSDGLLDLSADNDQETVSTNPETEDLGETEVGLQVGHSRNFTLSPETTDCDSNDIESELSVENEGSVHSSSRLYSSMPVLEDGLSSGQASETEDFLPENCLLVDERGPEIYTARNNKHNAGNRQELLNPTMVLMKKQISEIEREIKLRSQKQPDQQLQPQRKIDYKEVENFLKNQQEAAAAAAAAAAASAATYDANDPELEALDPIRSQATPPPPAPHAHRSNGSNSNAATPAAVEAAIKDIKLALQRTKTLPPAGASSSSSSSACTTAVGSTGSETRTADDAIWVPRQTGGRRLSEGAGSGKKGQDGQEEEEADTDQETDRLLGQLRPDDKGFFDEKDKDSSKKKGRNKEVLIEGVLFRARYLGSTQLVCEGQPTKSTRMMQAEEAVSRIKANQNGSQCSQGYNDDDEDDDDTDAEAGLDDHAHDDDDDEEEEEDELDETVGELTPGHGLSHSEPSGAMGPASGSMRALGSGTSGTVYRLRYLGSVEVEEETSGKRRRKRLKKVMVEEAVMKIKALAPDGETQPSTEVDLFISTEKIMVLNTDLKEIMMDHALRTISYIADIGDLVVLMARRRIVPQDGDEGVKINRTPKMICHVFESEEAQFIAQSIGQAFQVAYMEFLKANGIEDHSFVKEMDYQEVLNSQEIFGDELQMFAKKEMQKEVVVPKAKGEILGVVIVESGWGSMLPTVVIANLAPAGAAARCGQLNIGDQIIAINGISLVGLPLSTCQTYIKNGKNQTVVKLTVVPCPPVVEVKIKRPDTKYQLGFSVQNGVICSLLRGGIAERGGVRVGHRIIEINNQSVVAVPHEKIVNLLATSVGEILMKTMPTSMFRLLTGQETPVYI